MHYSRTMGMMIMMKSCILRPFVLLLLINSSMSGLGSVLVKSFKPVQKHFTWQEAQTFCRSSYTDLAVINKQSDADSLNLQNYHAWIGLHKQSDPVNPWVWPDGYLYYYQWAANEPQPKDTCAYVNYNDRRFYGTDCGDYYFYICYKDNYKYTFLNQSKTWSDARQYCRNLFHDLAVIYDYRDMDSALNPQRDFPVWTGLYRDGGTWRWSTGLSGYTKWAPNQPGDDGDCVAIYSHSKTMIMQNCSARFPFVCVNDNLLLVKKSMTWEEALEHCETITSPKNSPCQLVSVQPGDDYSYMMNRVMEADTDEVWTGLRFLAGSWVWINGADMLFYDLPTCPAPRQHCGAFSKNNTASLETRDCLEKKNFLCYVPQ